MTHSSTSSQPDAAPPIETAAIVALAREQLGEASCRLLEQPAALEALRRDIAAGRGPLDALLAVVHGRLGQERALDDEFTAFFLSRLERAGSELLPRRSRLRRLVDTSDLVDSVFRDLAPDLAGLEFRTRQQFLALLVQRVGWKAKDKSRGLHTEKRREDLRVAMPPENQLSRTLDPEQQPLGESIRNEEIAQLFEILQRLPERDRQLLVLHLQEKSLQAIAAEMGMSYSAAAKARTRAIKKAQQFIPDAECHRAHPGENTGGK